MGQTAQPDQQPTGENIPPAPPPAPRPITAQVARRAWAEQGVRIWWLMGFAVLLIAAYYAATRTYLWIREKNLINHGVQVQARVVGWDPNNPAPKGKHFPLPADTAVDLEYTYNGQPYHVRGGLAGRQEQILTHTNVPIFIDPAKPTRWTARMVPTKLVDQLLAAMLLTPVVCVLIAIAIIRRRKVLKIWRDGEGICAEVLDVRHAASAPRWRVVRCAVGEGDHALAVNVVVPASKAPEPGGIIWLIARQGHHSQCIPAGLFE